MASKRLTNQGRRGRTAPIFARDRRVVVRRALAIGAVVVVVGGVGYVALRGLIGDSGAEQTAGRFLDAWEEGRYADMWALLTPAARAEIDPGAFAGKYQDAARIATADEITAGKPTEDDGVVSVGVTARTAVFGDVAGPVAVSVTDEGIEWGPELVFPGLRSGETLTRDTKGPKRAALLDRTGETLIEGDADARDSILGDLTGAVEEPTDEDVREELYARGFPEGQVAGTSGFERIFEERVAGSPGGELRAGSRVLASSEPKAAEPVRTTLDLSLQNATTSALGGRIGGIVVLDARNGEIRAVAGGGLSNAQPPGSTFKIVTASAALDSGVAELTTEYPVSGYAVIDGFKLKNAHDGELCGGTLVESFAESCNSVFGPIGAEVGAERLVDMAERFGVNGSASVAGETPSTMPAASDLTSDLAVGTSAIGQGQVLMTPLGLASVAQTIADRGKRTPPHFDPEDEDAKPDRAVPKKVADEVTEMMEAVVTEGTGGLAAIDGIRVAGKTGTAEVGLSSQDDNDEIEDHAWFAAFAPANKPKLAVAVFIANAGFGGDVAAPVASQVLQAGLGVTSEP